jgi:hypothetical protein
MLLDFSLVFCRYGTQSLHECRAAGDRYSTHLQWRPDGQNDDGAIETQQPHVTPAATKTLPSVPGVFIHENHCLPHVFLINY